VSTYGTGIAGSGGAGPSELLRRLPYRGYQDPLEDGSRAWIEEWIDAIGREFDGLNDRFISAEARATLLDPTATDVHAANDYIANSTTAPALARSGDSMLDVLAFITLATYPLDGNLSTARQQQLVAIGAELLQRKGVGLALLRYLATLQESGAVYGGSTVPFQFAACLTDGEPTAGFGSWVSAAPEVARPWILTTAADYLAARLAPSWCLTGIGYSQFRLGFSSLEEPIFPVGATLNSLSGEHFASWTAGVPDGWTSAGAGTLTQNSSDASINLEFTPSCLDLDQTAAAAGVVAGVFQNTIAVDNQRTYRLEVDYAYRQGAAPYVAKLGVEVLDFTNTLYHDGTGWTSTPTLIPLDPTATSTTRTRFALAITWNPASSTTVGTRLAKITIKATSDGTASSQLLYRVWRAALYRQFDYADEIEAGGERTLSLPLVDAVGMSSFARIAVGGTVLEAQDASRTSFKEFDTSAGSIPCFPYSTALTARGQLFNSAWQNLVLGSCDFGADWTTSNYTRAANDATPPIVGAGTTCVTLLEAGATPTCSQAVVGATTAADRYVAGLLIEKVTADASTGGASVVELTLLEGAAVVMQRRFSLSSADGWQLLPLPACDALTGGAVLTFRIRTITGSASKFAVFGSYCYLATTRSTVLYPPIVETAIGATATIEGSYCQALNVSNIRDPLMQQPMITLARGGLNLSIIPTLGAGGVPDCYIFDVGQAATRNRLSLRVSSGALQARLCDDAMNAYSASLTLSALESPPAGSMTWRRDRLIEIRLRWDTSTGLRLSAGNGYAATSSGVPWTTSDASLGAITFGMDSIASVRHFDGIIRDVALLKCGAAI